MIGGRRQVLGAYRSFAFAEKLRYKDHIFYNSRGECVCQTLG